MGNLRKIQASKDTKAQHCLSVVHSHLVGGRSFTFWPLTPGIYAALAVTVPNLRPVRIMIMRSAPVWISECTVRTS
jgi:hypothetical protein